MGSGALQVLSAGRHRSTDRISGHPDDELWISAKELERATGWMLKPEGLCRGDVCTVLAPSDREGWVDGDTVCASGLWQSLGRPVLHDDARSVWVLGEAASERNSRLESLEAPDFTLPDITGKLHSLSDFRGKKVFLSTWASW
ncbi:MAG: redoxin domain-containing protein [Deltaproteobacteria bacterium]|nr:redoxin domain-containing protein [Deltaproteobacteria bacterium]MBW2417226.1 redoxin domain-containing protein [Deltaproteobacteria bacterium]